MNGISVTRNALTARLGAAALVSVVVFAIACVTVQLLRTDLDWQQAPLSFYLMDDYGLWLQTAYFVLGVALVLIGLGYYWALPPAARSAAPLLLFVGAGFALMVTAVADSYRVPRVPTFENFVHGIAAQTTFLFVTTAMLLQALRFRRASGWHDRFVPAFALGAMCFVALWVHALWRGMPSGLSQKIAVALIVSWLAMAAVWLWQQRAEEVAS